MNQEEIREMQMENQRLINNAKYWGERALKYHAALQQQQRGITRLRRRIGILEAQAAETQNFAVDNPTLTYKEVVRMVKECHRRLYEAKTESHHGHRCECSEEASL